MGVQVDLGNIQSGFQSAALLQSNYDEIEQGFDRALDRTQSTNNAMQVDIDMGNNDVINVKDLFVYGGLLINGDNVTDLVVAAKDDAEAAAVEANQYKDDAEEARDLAQGYKLSAESSATAAQQSETNAATSETNAAQSASAASTSETNAATSETNASTHEAGALSHKNDAEDARDLALQYRDTAEVHKNDAEQASDDAQQALFNFNARYYGPLADDPTEDPNGNPPTIGDWYFNTASNEVIVFDGSS